MTRTALVTGSAQRLGRAMALGLAAAGHDLVLHYHRSEEDVQTLAAEIQKLGRNSAILKADLSRDADVAGLIDTARQRGGSLSLLVNSASVFEQDDIKTMNRVSWDRHLNVNLWAPAKLAQDFAAQTDASVDNLIVNIIDQRVLKPTPQFLSYTLSKNALYALTTTLAQALGPEGIRVNAIGPGPTLRNKRQSETDWRAQNEATILGRGAMPEDIVAALLYLVGADAVTGQMIAVDGGQHLAWKTADVLVKE